MCFEIISGPTVKPDQITKPRTVTVSIRLRGATLGTATVTCDPGPLGPTQSRKVTLPTSPSGTSVSFPVQVDAAPGAYVIGVQVDQTGCVSEGLAAGLTVLVPEPAVKS
jgi:hypothetical protein